jgi:hypothetical protein
LSLTSLNFRQAAYAPETGRVIIALITIDHPELATPIRISTDPTARLTGEGYTDDTDVVYGTVSRSNTFVFLPVKIGLPNDTDEGPGEMTLEIDNIHRQYTATIRTITTPPTVQVELVLDNALDTVEAQWPEFLLTDIKYNATVITGTLKLETLEREPFPAGSFSPAYFGGLF